MSEDIAGHAFEPFYTIKAVGAGAGLGLSQVYGFAIQSRGMAFIRREHAGALADNADAAIRMELAQFDAVISDVMMPGTMDGIGLASWLAIHHPALPVVLCSGYMLDPHRLQSLRVEFVRKPYQLADLAEAIRRALKRGGQAGHDALAAEQANRSSA